MSYFNPRSPHGERPATRAATRCACIRFQSTLPARGATTGDHQKQAKKTFQSTLPARGATKGGAQALSPAPFQSTLPARGATVLGGASLCALRLISIHAPRTGSDAARRTPSSRQRKISIHAPRTGSDVFKSSRVPRQKEFQSTLPARGATKEQYPRAAALLNFNPRSPHGERQERKAERAEHRAISIHAPRTGSDNPERGIRRSRIDFNPRSPHGERLRADRLASALSISIHAPRTGSDRWHCWQWQKTKNFNPRSPHGERHVGRQRYTAENAISIHAPRTGSDAYAVYMPKKGLISIHAPRTGSDVFPLSQFAPPYHFNPRSPHGERPFKGGWA